MRYQFKTVTRHTFHHDEEAVIDVVADTLDEAIEEASLQALRASHADNWDAEHSESCVDCIDLLKATKTSADETEPHVRCDITPDMFPDQPSHREGHHANA